MGSLGGRGGPESEIFGHSPNRTRHKADPLVYQPTATRRDAGLYAEHHAQDFPALAAIHFHNVRQAVHRRRRGAVNPDLCGILRFKKFPRDGARARRIPKPANRACPAPRGRGAAPRYDTPANTSTTVRASSSMFDDGSAETSSSTLVSGNGKLTSTALSLLAAR